MDYVFEQAVTVADSQVNRQNRLKLSALLYYAQETAGSHCQKLGYDRESLTDKNLFWAVLRHRVLIYRLPVAGETITVRTWPMPVTKAAYPRAVRAFDGDGNILFELVSLWVLMDRTSRTMVLPGKSGVEVPGILLGDEPPSPGSLVPGIHQHSAKWPVSERDLDINGHVNNTKYLDQVEMLTDALHLADRPREITVCYLAETHAGEELTLQYSLSEDGIFTLDGTRPRADSSQKPERIFAVRLNLA